MASIIYFERDYPKRNHLRQLSVTSRGDNVSIHFDLKTADTGGTAELTIRQAVQMCDGILSAIQRCGVSLKERNRIAESLKVVALPSR